MKGWVKYNERRSNGRREGDFQRQKMKGGTLWRKKERNRESELVGCGLPGSNFNILPIATPKSLIVWPRTKYCRDHSTSASRRLAAENLAV